MNIDLPEGSFDAVYAIEATCHAPDKVGVYSQIHKVLKPGGLFAAYDWCTTGKFDPANPLHREIVLGIEKGNGLPFTATYSEVKEALEKAGFRIIEAYDVQLAAEVPWYMSLDGSFSVKGFRHTRIGYMLTHVMVATLEFLGIAPNVFAVILFLLTLTGLNQSQPAPSRRCP